SGARQSPRSRDPGTTRRRGERERAGGGVGPSSAQIRHPRPEAKVASRSATIPAVPDPTDDSFAPSAPPTPARPGVLLFAFLLAVVTYLDRVCISAAAPYISDDLQLTTIQMGQVLSAFALAYSLFEIPSGWLVDKIGPRRVLTRIVLWWSGFTMLTG